MDLLEKPRWFERASKREWVLLAAGLIVVSAFVLLLIGRTPLCDCGTFALWHGPIDSNETSQQLSDWYTFSHFIYGFIFYALLWLIARELPIGMRFFIAVALEAAWEIIENTDPVIRQFREVNIWRGYFGDSVLNSVGDIMAMAIGFWLAYRLPLWVSIIAIVAIDVTAALMIRDSLVIGTIMFFYQVEFIAEWQGAG